MERTKIAICFLDKEYLERFLKCWMHHYERSYEVHAYTSLEDLIGQKKDYEIILLEGMDIENLTFVSSEKTKVFYLTEEESLLSENYIVLAKYQELYKMEQQINLHFCKEITKRGRGNGKRKLIGVFSLDQEICQVPFCAMLATEYGQTNRCLLLNLQMASGLEAESELNLEDLLVAATTNTYTRSQLQDAIIQEDGWAYICPVKNTQYLVGVDKEIYEKLLNMLSEELGYDTYIINFGQMFEGCMEMMDMCEELFFLVPQREYKSRREKAFLQELRQYGLENIFEKMIHIEITQIYNIYEPWRNLAEKWRWNQIGDQVRENGAGR